MKLKRFTKKSKSETKLNKPFLKSKKTYKRPKRIEQKTKEKDKKRFALIATTLLLLFSAVAILFIIAYFYRSVISVRLQNNEIISPGKSNVIQIDEAKKILSDNNVSVQSLQYATDSASLTLLTQEGAKVYFSDRVNFSSQAVFLKGLIRSLQHEGKSAKIIDLRYNKPIVKF